MTVPPATGPGLDGGAGSGPEAVTAGPAWQRLHPLSPVVRGGRAGVPLLVLLSLTSVDRTQNGGRGEIVADLVVVGVIALLSLVHWLVTRWAFDGTTLRIDTGLLRRDSRRLPVSRIQAVDVVEPLLARILGLAELRIRVAGGERESRLAYLSEPQARHLRAVLLAAHHGLDAATPEPPEVASVVVPTGMLVGSVALSAPTVIFVLLLATLASVAGVSTKAAAAALTVSLVYLVALGTAVWRRFNEQYGFTVAYAPDGIRIRRGLLGTVAETVPVRRVQAVRQIEPLWWRLLGWCRLEVDLAGMPARDRSSGSRQVTKTLLPVGPISVAAALRAAVVGEPVVSPTPPPRRACWKAPLSYHFLRAGHDSWLAVASTGRLRKVTCWVPLHKAQSVRRVQGPLQRRLGLATVHLDVAGRRVEAEFKDRDAAEADLLVEQLAALSRTARRRDALAEPATLPQAQGVPAGAAAVPRAAPPAQPLVPAQPLAPAPPVTVPQPLAPAQAVAVPPGWYVDPTGRHAGRWFDGHRWTEHVDDYGARGIDPI